MRVQLLLLATALGLATANPAGAWLNKADPPEQRARALLAQMTLPEKLSMLKGSLGEYVGNVPAIPRLNIPALTLNDGPQGFRDETNPGTTTAFPSALTMAASWDEQVMYDWGAAMGQEFFDKGSNVFLGPGMNVARVPVNGRNFEYVSGEDPFLGYTLVQPTIRGVQSKHVIANAKHWVFNNQEWNRMTVSVNVDERTAFEIYYPPFEGAVEAEVGSFMCSYNKIHTRWSCENNATLNTDLRDRLGFKGWMMSDWGATHSTSIRDGLDQEMPFGLFMGDALARDVASGKVPLATIDTSVMRMLIPMFAIGVFDHRSTGHLKANVTSAEHNQKCREFSVQTTVLLQNVESILPLSKSVNKHIAVIGAQAVTPIIGGGGSGSVHPPYIVSPAHALKTRFGIPEAPAPQPQCDDAHFEANVDYFQLGSPSAPGKSAMDCCHQCGLLPNCNYFTFASNTTCYFKPNNLGRTAARGMVSGKARADPVPGPECNDDHCIFLSPTNNIANAVAAAKKAPVAVVFVGTTSAEGFDRANLALGDGQDQLVEAVAAANPNTIVVVSSPGAVLMPWARDVKAILLNFLPGQEVGNAVSDLLFGDANPSARLPVTIPNRENEVGFSLAQYPGLDFGNNATYSEGLLVGYRWYNQNGVMPRFPFGHGLSYTSFKYSGLVVNDADRSVTFTVENTGSVSGAEVAQLYVDFPVAAREPPMQLKAFKKISLAPGAKQEVRFQLRSKLLSIWDVRAHAWAPVPGVFGVGVGASSRDIRLAGELRV